MLRFRTNFFDDPFVMTNSESNPERGNKIEGSVCEHLAGIKILDVKRNLMFDVASNPTLHGSGNGSVSNMLLHGKFTESAVREGCSGNFEEEKKIVSFCECIVSFGHLPKFCSGYSATTSSMCELEVPHLSANYGQNSEVYCDPDRSLQRDAALSNLLYFASKHKLATKCFFTVRMAFQKFPIG
jgi:hypothetical protein